MDEIDLKKKDCCDSLGPYIPQPKEITACGEYEEKKERTRGKDVDNVNCEPLCFKYAEGEAKGTDTTTH